MSDSHDDRDVQGHVPGTVTMVYGVLGAACMPFLGVTLLLLLNSRRIAKAARAGSPT